MASLVDFKGFKVKVFFFFGGGGLRALGFEGLGFEVYGLGFSFLA